VSLSLVVLALVTLQRIGELLLARRNTARLRAQGAVEVGAGHYPVIVALHAAWLIGLWALAWNAPLNLPLLVVFLVLQGLRLWVLASLGPRWTTRILVLPGEPLVRTGPYRFLRHPNYVVVVAEIAVLPLAFGLVWYAVVFSALNAILLTIRIRAEDRAIARYAAGAGPG
jgi:methyltransferase